MGKDNVPFHTVSRLKFNCLQLGIILLLLLQTFRVITHCGYIHVPSSPVSVNWKLILPLLFVMFFVQVIFPSTLLGTGENWTMMKTISVTEYLNYEAG